MGQASVPDCTWMVSWESSRNRGNEITIGRHARLSEAERALTHLGEDRSCLEQRAKIILVDKDGCAAGVRAAAYKRVYCQLA